MENNSQQSAAAAAGLLEQQQQQLEMFWAFQRQEIEEVKDFKNYQLPLARIKNIMKADVDVSVEATILFSKACELFIMDLTTRSWFHAEENKRTTVQKDDIAAAGKRNGIFYFLFDATATGMVGSSASGLMMGRPAAMPGVDSVQPEIQASSNSMQDSNLTIPILPPELVYEILSRLPVKSLLIFRSVSKSWLALISGPEFIKTHLSLSAKKEDTHHMLISDLIGEKWDFKECPVRSLFFDSVPEAFDLDYPFQNNASENIKIMGSCNGLIFLAHYSEYSLLWNPTIRKYKNLPDFSPIWKRNFAAYGFGYDELHEDYKVVGIFYNYDGSDAVEVKIYSLKNDSWTSVDYCGEILNTSGSDRKMVLIGSGLLVNGKLHWDTITVGSNFTDGRMSRDIIYFDLANEKWEKMEKPSYGVGETNLGVGILGSDFCVFCDYEGTQISAWVRKEYGVKESWIKMFTIRYPNDQRLNPPFFMSNKGEILTVFGSTFVIYNSKDDAFRYPNVINCYDCHGAKIYVESLVCPFSSEVTEKATKEGGKSSDQNNRVTNNF